MQLNLNFLMISLIDELATNYLGVYEQEMSSHDKATCMSRILTCFFVAYFHLDQPLEQSSD